MIKTLLVVYQEHNYRNYYDSTCIQHKKNHKDTLLLLLLLWMQRLKHLLTLTLYLLCCDGIRLGDIQIIVVPVVVVMVHAEYVPSYPYLYATKDNIQASYPIREHIHYNDYYHHRSAATKPSSSSSAAAVTPAMIEEYDRQQLPFLYTNSIKSTTTTTTIETKSVVIVVYYLHWCNTCKKFTRIYQQLANKLQQIIQHRQQKIVHVQQQQQQERKDDNNNNHGTTDPMVQFVAISCSPNRKLCQSQNITIFPFMRIYFVTQFDRNALKLHDTTSSSNNNSNHTTYTKNLNYINVPQYTQLLSNNPISTLLSMMNLPMLLDDDTDKNEQYDDDSIVIDGTSTTHDYHERRWKRKRSRSELQHDIYMSLDYALRHELFRIESDTTTILSNIQQTTLYSFFKLCQQTIPTTTITYQHIQSLISELFQNFVYIVKSEDYLIAVLNEYMKLYIDRTTTNKSTGTIDDNNSNNKNNNDIDDEEIEFQFNDHYWSDHCSYNVNTGSNDQGYTCGLWELIHTITIGVVEYNHHTIIPMMEDSSDSDETSSGTNSVSYDEMDQNMESSEVTTNTDKNESNNNSNQYIDIMMAGNTIRNYIEHFFGCTTCKQHFLHAYDNCTYLDRCQRFTNHEDHDTENNDIEQHWMELPLYFYEFHNDVNIRLYKEVQQDLVPTSNVSVSNDTNNNMEEIQNILYPSKEYECNQCWIIDDSKNNTNDNHDSSKTTWWKYNRQVVYQYLQYAYGSRLYGSILNYSKQFHITKDSTMNVSNHDSEKHQRKPQSTSTISTTKRNVEPINNQNSKQKSFELPTNTKSSTSIPSQHTPNNKSNNNRPVNDDSINQQHQTLVTQMIHASIFIIWFALVNCYPSPPRKTKVA